MAAPPVNPYLRTQVMTARPEQLRLMLLDGAIRFCNVAKKAMTAPKPDLESSYTHIGKAQKIVLELQSSLNADLMPEVVEKMKALYLFLYRRLVDANTTRDPVVLDEVVRLLKYERQTWAMMIEKVQEDSGQGQPGPDGTPSASKPAAAAA